MVKAVIFDLDGTLLNTIDDLANSVNFMLKQFQFPTFSVDEYKYKVGNGMRKLIERSLPKTHKTDNQIDMSLSVFMEHYNQHKNDNTAPYEGIIDLLNELKNKGIKLAVVTNKAHISAKPLIENTFPNIFDEIAGQKEGIPTKPNPQSVLNVLEKLNATPDECLFIGDSGVDMQTAKNAQITAVGVLWGFREKSELIQNGADEIISSPLELLKFI